MRDLACRLADSARQISSTAVLAFVLLRTHAAFRRLPTETVEAAS